MKPPRDLLTTILHGSRLLITHDVIVGSQTVVGAGSLVTNKTANDVVADGVPASIVRSRTSSDPHL